MKVKKGITTDEITGETIIVYECDKCRAIDFDSKSCFWCSKTPEEQKAFIRGLK